MLCFLVYKVQMLAPTGKAHAACRIPYSQITKRAVFDICHQIPMLLLEKGDAAINAVETHNHPEGE